MVRRPVWAVLWWSAASALLAGAVVAAVHDTPEVTTRRVSQFENPRARAWKLVIMPDQPVALHRHDRGQTIVALRGGTLDFVDAAGKTIRTMTWETGKAYWLDADPPGQQHADLNRGTTPIEVMVVEAP